MIVTPLADPAAPASGTAPSDTPTTPEGPFSVVLASALQGDGASDEPVLDEAAGDDEPAVPNESAPDQISDNAVAALGLPTVATKAGVVAQRPLLLLLNDDTGAAVKLPQLDPAAIGDLEQTKAGGPSSAPSGDPSEPLEVSHVPVPDGQPLVVSEPSTNADASSALQPGASGAVAPEPVLRAEVETTHDSPGTETTKPPPPSTDQSIAAMAVPAGPAVNTAGARPPASPDVVDAERSGGEVATVPVQQGTPTTLPGQPAQAEATMLRPGLPPSNEAPSGPVATGSDAPPQQLAAAVLDPTQPSPAGLEASGRSDRPGDAHHILPGGTEADVLTTAVDDAESTSQAEPAAAQLASSSGDPMGQPASRGRDDTAPPTNRPVSEAAPPLPASVPPADAPGGDVLPSGQTVNVDLATAASFETTQSSGSGTTQRSSALPATMQAHLDEMRQAGETQRRLVVRLDPPELGSVTLELVNTGDELLIRARTDSQDAVRALMRQREDLQTVIETLGMSLAEFDVREESQQQHDQQRRSSRLRSTELFTDPDATDLEVASDHEGALFL